MKGWILAAAGLLAAVAPAGAQEGADDLLSKIVNSPAPASYRVDGARASVRNDDTVQGGKALRIPVAGKSDKSWTTSIASAIGKPVKKGDALILAFWAKLTKGEAGVASASLPFNGVQLAADPYTPVFSGAVTIGPEWKMYEVKGRADRDYQAGMLNATLHLATGKQTIDVGPVFVLNVGQ